jgi:hypothetical protein
MFRGLQARSVFVIVVCAQLRGAVVAEQRGNDYVSQAALAREQSTSDSSNFIDATSIPAGICVKNTGQQCMGYDKAHFLDHFQQCAGGHHSEDFLSIGGAVTRSRAGNRTAYCNAHPSEKGLCHCKENYCADVDRTCHRGNYRLVGDVFSIKPKLAAWNELLFMNADGNVQLGVPPDPRAAKWRIAVTRSGVKMLWSELYINSVLQEYETCTTLYDAQGNPVQKCFLVVGHAANVRANEMAGALKIFKVETIMRACMDYRPYPMCSFALPPQETCSMLILLQRLAVRVRAQLPGAQGRTGHSYSTLP